MGTVLPQPIQFGKYTLFERIGRGGMADVFKARVQGPAGFERVFVVKRILPHLSDDASFNQMFVEEAKMSARLNHPNIVQVFELGSVEGEYFISMEYVRGRDLAESMRTLWARIGPPRPELVAYVGREMCRALDYAHHLRGDDGKPIGMIHRDVSPSNVMLSYEGAVKLLDFGIAKALGGEVNEGTQKGTLKGKFAYMAPEQTRGSNVDHRIDIFATGIVLHEVLTGRRLFKGENDLQTVEKVRQCEVPPPSLHNPLCPPELDAIVLRALAPNPAHRFQSAGEMAEALDDIVHVTRFQPAHLAGIMRDLFPGDAPADGRPPATGSVRVSQSMPASPSRPYPLTGTRSPTVPPVTITSGSISQPTGGSSPLAENFQHKPLVKSTGFMLTMFALMLAGGVAGGVWWTQRTAEPAQPVAAAGVVKDGPIKVRVDSIPDGAEVMVRGGAEVLCKTPCLATIQWRADSPTVLLLRKKGYEDIEREVRPPLAVFASLRPGRSSLQDVTDPRRPVIENLPPERKKPAIGEDASKSATGAKPSEATGSEPGRSSDGKPAEESRGGSSARRKKPGKDGLEIVDPFQ